MKETATTRLHHPFSPSKLQYLEACPYWEPQENINTKASERGTAQHDAAEATIDIDDPALEDHEAIAVAMCKKYRDGIIDEVVRACSPEKVDKSNRPIILKEEYVWIDDELVNDAQGNQFKGTTGGYLDLAIIAANEKFAHILDWKFGLWSVEPAENNLQGMAYLLGVFKRYPTLEEITVHFVCPHRDEIDVATFKRSEFPALLLRIQTVVARARAARRPRPAVQPNCTVGGCLFCGAKGKCEKLAEIALKLGKKYAPLTIPEQLTPSLMLDSTFAKTSMETAQVLEGWCKAVRGRITARAIEQDEWMPEGYVLRERADTKVKNQSAFANAARKRGVSDEVIVGAMKYAMEPIYKAIRDQAPRGLKEEAEKDFREQNIAAGICEKEQPIWFLERLKS
jgi:hypothetical protein